jgi:hypothetical protein
MNFMDMDKNAHAYDIYVSIQAEGAGRNEAEIRAEISREAFERQVRQLHYQWLCGEFSFGRFTELIDVPDWELRQILDALNLPRRNR